jgi:hypothetical protein
LFRTQAGLISRDGTGVETEKTPGKIMVNKEKLTVGLPQQTDRLYTPTRRLIQAKLPETTELRMCPLMETTDDRKTRNGISCGPELEPD